MSATLILLCGRIGSGKSTFAYKLKEQGVEILSLDDRVLKKTEQFRDPNNDHRLKESVLRQAELKVQEENLALAKTILVQGRSVAFDYGFWKRHDRDKYRQIAADLGVEFLIYYLDVDPTEQARRVAIRNQGDLKATHFISKEELELFNGRFEPADDDEGAIVLKDVPPPTDTELKNPLASFFSGLADYPKVSSWRRRLSWVAIIVLFLGLVPVRFLCAVPDYYFGLAIVTGIPIVLGDRFLRCLGMLFLIIALWHGLEDSRMPCLIESPSPIVEEQHPPK